MQLIPSAALSDVIAEHQSISAYIRKIHGISPDANLHDNAIPRGFIEPYIMSLCTYNVLITHTNVYSYIYGMCS